MPQNHFLRLAPAISLAVLLSACGDAPKSANNSTPIAPTSPQALNADLPRFDRTRYSAVSGGTVVELISPKDLEYKKGDKTFLCKYTREQGRLRVVIEAAGSKTVEYFNEGPEGLTSDDGTRLYLPAALELASQYAWVDEAKRLEAEAAKAEAAKRQKQLELELAKATDEKRRREIEAEQTRIADEKRHREADLEQARIAEDNRRRQQQAEQARLAEIKRRQDQERAFARAEFWDLDRKFSLIMVSPTEVEYKKGPKTVVGQYTRDQRGLRVVIEGTTAKTIEYFTEIPEGWRAESGVVFYRPELIDAVIARRKADELFRKKQELEAELARKNAEEFARQREMEERLARERAAFVKTPFTALDRGSLITLISPNELEYRRGDRTLLCQYTREPGKLRVVVESRGAKTVEYFLETPEGLRADDGSIFYHPAKLDAAIARAQAEYLKRQEEIFQRNLAFAQKLLEKAETVGGAIVAGKADAPDEKILFAPFKADKGIYNIVFNRALREKRSVKRERSSLVDGAEHLTVAKIDTGRKLDEREIGYCFVNGNVPAVYARKIIKSKENDLERALGQIVVIVIAENDDIFRAAQKDIKFLPAVPLLPPAEDVKPADPVRPAPDKPKLPAK